MHIVWEHVTLGLEFFDFPGRGDELPVEPPHVFVMLRDPRMVSNSCYSMVQKVEVCMLVKHQTNL